MCKDDVAQIVSVENSNPEDGDNLQLEKILKQVESALGKKFSDFSADEVSAVFRDFVFSPLGILP